MEQGLFDKYKKELQKRTQNKEVVILYIQEVTGILLTEDVIELKKKQINLHISSTQKNHFHTKNLKELLKKEGYILNY